MQKISEPVYYMTDTRYMKFTYIYTLAREVLCAALYRCTCATILADVVTAASPVAILDIQPLFRPSNSQI